MFDESETCEKCGGTVGHKINCPVGIAEWGKDVKNKSEPLKSAPCGVRRIGRTAKKTEL